MSLPPANRSADHYVYRPASAASTQRIIDEGVQASSGGSFTSARASPTPSVRSRPAGHVDRSATSYKQALEEAEAGARVDGDGNAKGRGFPVRTLSWNEQDLKHAMQRGLFVKSGGSEMQGFSERGCGEYVKGEEAK
ncbi:MAG: hypothetical protein M1840_007429 [Geoglossum simile]|nr:MAG: hypothetical protein M1840_007429 [Geoglossum simile]